ncbi:MAG TPA: methyltransferase domain-containing protein [Candidatus Dormibacteraeota bacterium]
MTGGWTNEAAIERWGSMPRDVLERMDPDGDFAKRHLLNPVLLQVLGDVRGRHVLDAGCGQGYFSRMLAARGARVVGVEPGRSLFDHCVEREAQLRQGIRYVRADLSDHLDLGPPFDACVASMVLGAVPDWRRAMRSCVEALAPGGLFVFTLNHPCFEQLWPVWREHRHYRVSEYLQEYEITGPHATDFHRPLSAYLNEVSSLGCRLRSVAEPALDAAVAATGPEGIEAYVHLPNFVVVAAERG